MANEITNSSIETLQNVDIGGITVYDYPDFSDAYVEYAEYEDGTPLTDIELDKVNDKYTGWINRQAHDSLC